MLYPLYPEYITSLSNLTTLTSPLPKSSKHTINARIISILDGELKHDTNPYNPSEEEVVEDKVSYEKKDEKDKAKKKQKKIKSAMSYATAFNLSLKNLWSSGIKSKMVLIIGLATSLDIAVKIKISYWFSSL